MSRAKFLERMRVEITKRQGKIQELRKDAKYKRVDLFYDELDALHQEFALCDERETVIALRRATVRLKEARTIDAACAAITAWHRIMDGSPDWVAELPNVEAKGSTPMPPMEKSKGGRPDAAPGQDVAMERHYLNLRKLKVKAKTARANTARYFGVSDGRVAAALRRRPMHSAFCSPPLPD